MPQNSPTSNVQQVWEVAIAKEHQFNACDSFFSKNNNKLSCRVPAGGYFGIAKAEYNGDIQEKDLFKHKLHLNFSIKDNRQYKKIMELLMNLVAHDNQVAAIKIPPSIEKDKDKFQQGKQATIYFREVSPENNQASHEHHVALMYLIDQYCKENEITAEQEPNEEYSARELQINSEIVYISPAVKDENGEYILATNRRKEQSNPYENYAQAGIEIGMAANQEESLEKKILNANIAYRKNILQQQMSQPSIPPLIRGLAAIGQKNTQHQDKNKSEWLFRDDARSIQQHPAWPLASAGAGREQGWLEKTFDCGEDELIRILDIEPPPNATSIGEIKEVTPERERDEDSIVHIAIVQGIGVNDLHRTALGQNAVLQVASQFDFQESTGAYDTPVSKYVTDRTQGPQAAIEAAAAALHRKAAKKNGKLPHALSDILTIAIQQKYPKLYKDGYLDLTVINNEKDKQYLLNVIEKRIDKLKILPQWALCETSGAQQLQVFCAAPSFQNGTRPKPGSVDDRICKKLVVAQYVATAQLAVIRSKQLNEPVPLHLTLVGQGAFNNDPSVMKEAFEAVSQVVKGTQVQVYAHAYSSDSQHLLEAQLAEAEQQGKVSLHTMSAHQFRQAQHPGQHLEENSDNVKNAYNIAKSKIPKATNPILDIPEDKINVLVDKPELSAEQLSIIKNLTEVERMALDQINSLDAKNQFWPDGIHENEKLDLFKKIQPLINSQALCNLLVKDNFLREAFFNEFNLNEHNLENALNRLITEVTPKTLSIGQTEVLIKSLVENLNKQNGTSHDANNIAKSYSNLILFDRDINANTKLSKKEKRKKLTEFKKESINFALTKTAKKIIKTPMKFAPEGIKHQHIQMAYTRPIAHEANSTFIRKKPKRSEKGRSIIGKNRVDNTQENSINQAIEYCKEMKELMDDLKHRHALVRYQEGTDFEGYGANWRQSELKKWLEKEENTNYLKAVESFDNPLMELLGNNYSEFSIAFNSLIRGNLVTRERVISESGKDKLEHYLIKNPQIAEYIANNAEKLQLVNQAFSQHVQENIIREPQAPLQEEERIKLLKDILASKQKIFNDTPTATIQKRITELQTEIQQLEMEYATKNIPGINPEIINSAKLQQNAIQAFEQFCSSIANNRNFSANDVARMRYLIPDDEPHSKLKSTIESLNHMLSMQEEIFNLLVSKSAIFVNHDNQTYMYEPSNMDATCYQKIIDYHAALLNFNEKNQEFLLNRFSASDETLIALDKTLVNSGYSSIIEILTTNSLKAEPLMQQMQQINQYISTESFSKVVSHMELEKAKFDLAMQRKTKELAECDINPILLSDTNAILIHNFIENEAIYHIEQGKLVEHHDNDLLSYIQKNISAENALRAIQEKFKAFANDDAQQKNAYLDKAFAKFAELINHQPQQQYAKDLTQSEEYIHFKEKIAKNSTRFNIIENALDKRESLLSSQPQQMKNLSAMKEGNESLENKIENFSKKTSSQSKPIVSLSRYFSKRRDKKKQKKIERQEQLQALDTIFNDIRSYQALVVACTNMNDLRKMQQNIGYLNAQIQEVIQSRAYDRSATIKQQVEIAKINMIDLNKLTRVTENFLKKDQKRQHFTPFKNETKKKSASSHLKNNNRQSKPVKISKHRNRKS